MEKRGRGGGEEERRGEEGGGGGGGVAPRGLWRRTLDSGLTGTAGRFRAPCRGPACPSLCRRPCERSFACSSVGEGGRPSGSRGGRGGRPRRPPRRGRAGRPRGRNRGDRPHRRGGPRGRGDARPRGRVWRGACRPRAQPQTPPVNDRQRAGEDPEWRAGNGDERRKMAERGGKRGDWE